MENKLTIAHLAPYLPYSLKIIDGWGDVRTMRYTHLDDNGNGWIGNLKPILKPLSKITHDEMEEIIKSAWGWDEVVAFHGVDSVIVCIKDKDYDPSKLSPDFHDDYDLQYIEEQEESCGSDAIVTVPVPFKLTDVISYCWQDEFMYSVDIKHHDRFIKELYKRHYDLQGLIKAGLAIEEGGQS